MVCVAQHRLKSVHRLVLPLSAVSYLQHITALSGTPLCTVLCFDVSSNYVTNVIIAIPMNEIKGSVTAFIVSFVFNVM
jgi:hypothetical protein